MQKVKSFPKLESFSLPLFELVSFSPEFVCRAKQIGIRVFSWNRVQKISNISSIKGTNSTAFSFIVHCFFSLLSLFLSTDTFLFASQFNGNSFVDFGTCCCAYKFSIVVVAKDSIAAVSFSPTSKRSICLFFLFTHKATSHTGDFYRAFFQGSLSRAACLSGSPELNRGFYRENLVP